MITRCKICGNNSSYNFTSIDISIICEKDYEFYLCRDCNYYFIHPTPDSEYMSKWYNDHPILVDDQGLIKGVQEYLNGSNIIQKNSLNDIFKILELEVKFVLDGNKNSQLSILDVGCGAGILLHFLREKTEAKVTGIDLNKHVIEVGKKYLGLENFYDNLHELSKTGEKFDIISLIDVIEHLSDPVQTILDAKSLLKEKGIILLRCPSTDGFLFNKSIPERWKWVYAPYHLSLFSNLALEKLARQCNMHFQLKEDRLLSLTPHIIHIRLLSDYKFLHNFILSKIASLFSRFFFLF